MISSRLVHCVRSEPIAFRVVFVIRGYGETCSGGGPDVIPPSCISEVSRLRCTCFHLYSLGVQRSLLTLSSPVISDINSRRRCNDKTLGITDVWTRHTWEIRQELGESPFAINNLMLTVPHPSSHHPPPIPQIGLDPAMAVRRRITTMTSWMSL